MLFRAISLVMGPDITSLTAVLLGNTDPMKSSLGEVMPHRMGIVVLVTLKFPGP